MTDTTDSVSFCEHTQRLVRERPRTMTYADLGAKANVHPRWIEKFANNAIPEPGCSKVEKVYTALTGRPVIEGL